MHAHLQNHFPTIRHMEEQLLVYLEVGVGAPGLENAALEPLRKANRGYVMLALE